MNQLKTTILLFFCAFITITKAQTVYTTKTGEKYHKSNCRYLKYSKKETTIKKAKELGFLACKVCKPTLKNTPSKGGSSSLTSNQKKQYSKKTTATQCTGKTKSGKRCKRRTKNSNGRCYQH